MTRIRKLIFVYKFLLDPFSSCRLFSFVDKRYIQRLVGVVEGEGDGGASYTK